jgi:RNA polymerase sigma factor (sigma-70 family)
VVAVHGGNHLGRCRIYINDGRFVTEMERQDLNDAAEAVQPPSRRDLERSAAMAQDTFEASIDALLTDGYRVAFAILRHRQEAEDVLQDAAANAWAKRQHVHDPAAMRAWFLTIVTNSCRMRLRSSWWRRERVLGGDLALDRAEGLRHEVTVETRIDLTRASANLTWEQRAVVAMFYQLDMPQEDIARVLRIRIGTVKSRLSRAITTLRQAMSEENRS